MENKTLTDIITELETLKELFAEHYHEELEEAMLLKGTEQTEKIKQNEWDRAYMIGKITGLNVALSMLKN
jgi:hypothetical protein